MISIIGAGPVGNYLAFLLARNGLDVRVFEEHAEIGRPVQCTGIVTKDFFKLVRHSKRFVVNELGAVRVIAPSCKTEIPLKEFVLDRTALDSHLAELAADAGAELFTGYRFTGLCSAEPQGCQPTKTQNSANKTRIVLRHNNKKVVQNTNVLVGADGPQSAVARAAGIYGRRKFFFGMQATIKGRFDANTFLTWFGDCCPGFFAWLVPESGTTARAGLATMLGSPTKKYFDAFIARIHGKIIDRQAGLIPVYNPKQVVQQGRTFLVGDAATFAKATTGGGLVPGLTSAKLLAGCIANSDSYSKELRGLRRELWLHLLLRKMLNKFNNNDYDKLVGLMDSERVKKLLSERTRERPSKLLLRLLMAEPRMLGFVAKVF